MDIILSIRRIPFRLSNPIACWNLYYPKGRTFPTECQHCPYAELCLPLPNLQELLPSSWLWNTCAVRTLWPCLWKVSYLFPPPPQNQSTQSPLAEQAHVGGQSFRPWRQRWTQWSACFPNPSFLWPWHSTIFPWLVVNLLELALARTPHFCWEYREPRVEEGQRQEWQ